MGSSGMVRFLILRLFAFIISLIIHRWKLRMRPSHLPMIRNLQLKPLPARVSVDDVFSHFLGYVKQQLQGYITTQFGAGGDIWASLFPTMYAVLTTPNGWEGAQQQRMRAAAVQAGLVDKDGARRVRFVTEAEVSSWLLRLLLVRPLMPHFRRLFCTQ